MSANLENIAATGSKPQVRLAFKAGPTHSECTHNRTQKCARRVIGKLECADEMSVPGNLLVSHLRTLKAHDSSRHSWNIT